MQNEIKNVIRLNKEIADTFDINALFALLYMLIEVQYQANMYRSGNKSNLTGEGICNEVDTVILTINLESRLLPRKRIPYIPLSRLFFKGMNFPFRPYYPPGNTCELSFRWGHNLRGLMRMEALEYMIKQLLQYLNKRTKP